MHGTAKTIRIVSLPDLPDKGDVSDWLDADARRAEKLGDVCFDVRVWTPDDAAANLAAPEVTARDIRADTSVESKPTTEPPPLPFINIAAWDGTAAPEREWVVQDRVPLKNVTLLSGEGGVGKSVISLHLARRHSGATGSTACQRRARRSLCAARTTPTSCTAGLIE